MKFFRDLKAAAIASAAALLVSGGLGYAAFTFSTDRIIGTGAAAPALTSCGTSPAIVGTDLAGQVTMGTGTPAGCVITFNVPKTNVPYCLVNWPAQILAAQSYVVSATAITLTQTATSSNKVNYICIDQAGG